MLTKDYINNAQLYILIAANSLKCFFRREVNKYRESRMLFICFYFLQELAFFLNGV